MRPKIPFSRISSALVVIWDVALAIALSKGMLTNLVPTQVVAAGLVVPPFAILCYWLRGLVIHLNKVVSLLIYLLIGLAAGFAVWGIFAMSSTGDAHADTGNTSQTDPRVTKVVQDIQELKDIFTKSPSVNDAAKVPLLQDRILELSKEKETLTNREKEILSSQAPTLESLEQARTQYLKRVEVEKRQKELNDQQKEIQQRASVRVAQEQNELREKTFANQHTPVVEYAITSLYRQLSDISRESSEPLVSDFPGDHPSIHGSAMLKDGKFENGGHVIRVGSHKEWEFRVSLSGIRPNLGTPEKRFLGFQIQAGATTMFITNQYPRMGPPPPELKIWLRAGDKESYSAECSLSDYQKPIDEAVRELIKDRYYESPLRGKH